MELLDRPLLGEGSALAAPHPKNEKERLAALHECGIPDPDSWDAYDDIVQLAAFVCGTPIAAVSVVDADTQQFKSSVGLEIAEVPRETAFCAHTILCPDLTVVPDAQADERFASDPLVTGDPGIRFYAGAPLINKDGEALGSLCVIDRVPRRLTLEQQSALQALARQVVSQIKADHLERAKRQEAEFETARLAEYNRLLLESTAEGIYGMDTAGRCTFINKAATRLLGYTSEEVRNVGMHDLIHHTYPDGTHYPVQECPIYKAFQLGQPCHMDTEVLWRKDGTSFSSSYSSYPMTEAGVLVGAVVTFSDITERKRVEQEKEVLLAEAQARADRDPLTNLLNHRAFHSCLVAEADRARREHSVMAIVMLDLDNFKFFNDVYGHTTGDEVLRLVAGRLREVCRSYDTLARFGGDEFALLLPNIGQATREEIEGRLRKALSGLFYCFSGPLDAQEVIPISISLGAARFPIASSECHEVLRQADERLRWSKTGGNAEENARRVRADAGSRVDGFGMLDALVAAVDNKDRYTRRHSEDVMVHSLQIARQLGLSSAGIQAIGVAALLHDVGKIGVPDAILRKPGRLTDKEFEAIKQHPVMGAVMVSAVPGLEDVLDAVRHHHERWDGGGYPAGLRGEETPLMARIMAVADAYSAMTADRPYRKGMEPAKALAILRSGTGTQWDPACVEAFLRARQAEPSQAGLSEDVSVTILHETVPD